MITFENYEVLGWEHAIRGMRNPMNSWDRMDSFQCVFDTPIFDECEGCIFNENDERCARRDEPIVTGKNDHKLMMKLAEGGPVHAKYRRMIDVYVDITAPLYWWKEFDTYKVGTVSNSCSTMHKIHDKEFTMDDFSCEHLLFAGDRNCVVNYPNDEGGIDSWGPLDIMHLIVESLNVNRWNYNETIEKMKNTTDASEKLALKEQAKKCWWQMIQLLPSAYNQKRTIKINYEVLANIYEYRKNHKLDEWREFCKWIESLPYSEIITVDVKDDGRD